MLDDPNWETYLDSEVVDGDGKSIGTIVDFDRDDGTFYLEPSEEISQNTWEQLGWNADEYDENWEDLDYERWREGEANLTVNYDEWPYTLAAERIEGAGDEVHLTDYE